MSPCHLSPQESNHVKNLAQRWLSKDPKCKDWRIGNCHARHANKDCYILEAFNREMQPYWLYLGPWREWGRVGEEWSHLSWVCQTMSSLSPLFRLLGPILPPMDWTGLAEGFVGRSPRRPGKPFLELVCKGKLGPETLIQLTGFLRLIQIRSKRQIRQSTRRDLVSMEKAALGMVDRVRHMIPDQAPYRRWQVFYLQNARSLATGNGLRQTWSIGRRVSQCFTVGDKGGLQVNLPFFLCQELAGMDLCRLLIKGEEASRQDRQYLIDFYYNRQVPSQFFTLLAYQHMTSLLKKIEKKSDQLEREQALAALASFSRNHDGFRSPVPAWYLA